MCDIISKLTISVCQGCVWSGKCPSGKCPLGKCPWGKCPSGKCPLGKCLVGEMSVGELSGHHKNVFLYFCFQLFLDERLLCSVMWSKYRLLVSLRDLPMI